MYIKESRGSSILPCDTPTVTGCRSDVELLIDVSDVRDDKYDVNQLTTENPRFHNFIIIYNI
jgi:phosphorylcholine metabolism protein LicD